MIRDAEFYKTRHCTRLRRKMSRMRATTLVQMVVLDVWKSRYEILGKRPMIDRHTTHWRHRRTRAIVRARSHEMTTAIEVGLHGMSRAFATWPDTWEHKHYFGEPVGTICNCGTCQHGIKNGAVACPLGCARATTADILKMAAVALAGLFIRDVQ